MTRANHEQEAKSEKVSGAISRAPDLVEFIAENTIRPNQDGVRAQKEQTKGETRAYKTQRDGFAHAFGQAN
jgi:hypothetical protein